MSRAHASISPPFLSVQPLRAGQSFHGASDTGPSEQPVDRQLSCIAGFYGHEHQAQTTAAQIRREHGLGSSQLLLLSPQDAPRKRFSRLARLWSGHRLAGRQSAFEGHLSVPLLGLAVMMLLAWAALLWSDGQSVFSQTPTQAGLGSLGGLLALAGAAAWLRQRNRKRSRPHVRRFELRVQQQLALGHWALVVCKLPWAQQAGVLAQLRAGSLRWCAVAEPSARL